MYISLLSLGTRARDRPRRIDELASSSPPLLLLSLISSPAQLFSPLHSFLLPALPPLIQPFTSNVLAIPSPTRLPPRFLASELKLTAMPPSSSSAALLAHVHSSSYHSPTHITPTTRQALLDWFDTVRDERAMPWRKRFQKGRTREEGGQRAYEVSRRLTNSWTGGGLRWELAWRPRQRGEAGERKEEERA